MTAAFYHFRDFHVQGGGHGQGASNVIVTWSHDFKKMLISPLLEGLWSPNVEGIKLKTESMGHS